MRSLVGIFVAIATVSCSETPDVRPAGGGGAGGSSASDGGKASGGAGGTGGESSTTSAANGTGGATVTSTSTGPISTSTSTTGSGQGGAGGIAPPECATPTDCPPVANGCQFQSCSAGMCDLHFVPANVALPAIQVPGDCATAICDGAGNVSSQYAPSDLTDDGNACTADSCTANGPSYQPIGGGQCHAVCILDQDSPMNDGQGQPAGDLKAGPYAACGIGASDLSVPAPRPWLWEFIGVVWTIDGPIPGPQDETDYRCGDNAAMTAFGYGAYPTNSTCPTGTACQMVLRAGAGGAFRNGTCQ